MTLIRHLTIIFFLSFPLFGDSQTIDWEWKSLVNYPDLGRDDAIAFSIADTIYFGSGNHGGFSQSNIFYKYSTSTNTWALIAPFPGVARQYSVAATIGNKGYLCGGIDLFNNPLNDLWEYDPTTNTWAQLAKLPAAPRWQAASFVLNNELYVGSGRSWEEIYKDFWCYNPKQDEWRQVSDLPKLPCYETVSFELFDFGYLGLGRDCTGVYLNDFWKYNPLEDDWNQEIDFPADARYYAKAEAYNGFGIVGSGQNEAGLMLNDFWAFDPIQKAWTEIPVPPMSKRKGLASATIPFHGVFFIAGIDESFNRRNEMYRLNIISTAPVSFRMIYSQPSAIIYLTEIGMPANVQVFDVNGRIIYESTAIDSYIYMDVAGWTKGLYLVRVNNEVKKIILY